MRKLMELDVVDRQGMQVGKIEVDEKAFAAEVKGHLFHQVVRMQLANRRQGTAATKTRGEVSGGGKKPWRQKGTGRARAGSTRSPLWRGGGVALGPKPRNYSYSLPKKVKRAALRSALTLKLQEGLLKIIDRLELPEPKTKQMVGLLKTLGVEKSALIVIAADNLNVQLAARNLPSVQVMRAEGMNIYDLLSHDFLICTQDALMKLHERVAR